MVQYYLHNYWRRVSFWHSDIFCRQFLSTNSECWMYLKLISTQVSLAMPAKALTAASSMQLNEMVGKIAKWIVACIKCVRMACAFSAVSAQCSLHTVPPDQLTKISPCINFELDAIGVPVHLNECANISLLHAKSKKFTTDTAAATAVCVCACARVGWKNLVHNF